MDADPPTGVDGKSEVEGSDWLSSAVDFGYLTTLVLAAVALFAGWAECTSPKPDQKARIFRFPVIGPVLARIRPIGWLFLFVVLITTALDAYLSARQDARIEAALESIQSTSENIRTATRTVGDDIATSVALIEEQAERIEKLQNNAESLLVSDLPIHSFGVIAVFEEGFDVTALEDEDDLQIVSHFRFSGEMFDIAVAPKAADDADTFGLLRGSSDIRLYPNPVVTWRYKTITSDVIHVSLRQWEENTIGKRTPWSARPSKWWSFSTSRINERLSAGAETFDIPAVVWPWETYGDLVSQDILIGIDGAKFDGLAELILLFNYERYVRLPIDDSRVIVVEDVLQNLRVIEFGEIENR